MRKHRVILIIDCIKFFLLFLLHLTYFYFFIRGLNILFYIHKLVKINANKSIKCGQQIPPKYQKRRHIIYFLISSLFA